MNPTLHLVLHQPEIPQNTGNVGRTCLAIGGKLWLVKPLGFEITEKRLRRAGLDYWQHLDVEMVESWAELTEKLVGKNFWFFSRHATHLYTEVQYQHGDVLVFGCETNGLPTELMAAAGTRALRIPAAAPVRSLNLSSSVAVAAYEAVRQIGVKE